MRHGDWSDSPDWCSSCLLPPASCSLAPAPCSLRALSPRAIAPPPPPPHHRTSPGEDPGPIAPRHPSGAIHGPGSSPGEVRWLGTLSCQQGLAASSSYESAAFGDEIKPASLPPPCGEGIGVGVATRANACGFIPGATSAPAPHDRKGVQSNYRTTKRTRARLHCPSLRVGHPRAPCPKNQKRPRVAPRPFQFLNRCPLTRRRLPRSLRARRSGPNPGPSRSRRGRRIRSRPPGRCRHSGSRP